MRSQKIVYRSIVSKIKTGTQPTRK